MTGEHVMIFESASGSLVRFVGRPTLVLLLCVAVGGCAPRTAEEVAADRARVLGTWEYRTNGIGALQRGTLQIMVQDAKLVGRFQDSWRGQVQAKISLHGTRMELNLDLVRIQGRLEHGRFTGSVHRPLWDVSRSSVRGRGSDGQFVARKVQDPETVNDGSDLGCASLLHESSYTCKALGS